MQEADINSRLPAGLRLLLMAYACAGIFLFAATLHDIPDYESLPNRLLSGMIWLIAGTVIVLLCVRRGLKRLALTTSVAACLGMFFFTSYEDSLLEFPRYDLSRQLRLPSPDMIAGGSGWEELGRGWRVVNYWTKYCAPCVAELPQLQRFADTHPAVSVVGVTHLLGGTPPDTEVASLHEFLDSRAIRFPSLVFRSYVALAPFRFKALPTTLLVDPAGYVVAEAAGSRDLPMLLARAARLAREAPSNPSLQRTPPG